jgi:carboxyl-terminal processing protease
VYGGGGITPDIKYEQPKLNDFQLGVLRKNGFFDFSAHYFANHSTKEPAGWTPDEEILNAFHDYLMKQGLQFSEADWTQNHDWVRNQLRAEMYITAFSYEDAQKIAVVQDPEVQKAIDAIPQAAALLTRSETRIEKQRASR